MTEYKQKLEEEKARLTEELGKLGKLDSASGDWEARPEAFDPNEIDDNQRADRFEDYEEKTALIVPLEIRLTEIHAALKSIEEGTYGVCRVCHKPIEPARLGANPAAATCIEHMEA